MKNKKTLVLFMAGMIASVNITGCGATDKTSKTETSEASSDYYYGTLDLSYADYYYGELNQIEPEPEAATGKYDAENAVEEAGYTKEGMYDAVTSATTQKSQAFEAAFTEESENGINILGPSNVNVAISKSLYDDVVKASKNGTECSNKLIELVNRLDTVTEEVPEEYKVINSDGTLSKTVGNTVKGENITASITTTSPWGNYAVSLEGLKVSTADVQGVIFETEDGALYGLQHEDNIWLQASELAFSVKEFVDPHENVAGYERFKDIEGKTITKITYLLSNQDDIVIETSLFVKEQLADKYSASCSETETYNLDGTKISVEQNVPEDSNYTISDVVKSRVSMESGTYSMENNIVTLNSDLKPGQYSIIFSDKKYADLKVSCLILSELADNAVSFKDGILKLVENEKGITVSDYISGITAVMINGNPLNGMNLGSVIFNEDGSINMDAVISRHGEETAIFEKNGSYDISLDAAGYPSVSFSICKE